MSFKIFSHKLIMRKQNKHSAGFCSKLIKVSSTSVTLPEKHVKHAPESENLRGSGLPQLPLVHTNMMAIGQLTVSCGRIPTVNAPISPPRYHSPTGTDHFGRSASRFLSTLHIRRSEKASGQAAVVSQCNSTLIRLVNDSDD